MNLPNRKSPRLKGYDYNQNGAYFITICTENRLPILSQIVGTPPHDTTVQLTSYGMIAEQWIQQLPKRFDITLHAYVIMPNHIHLLFHTVRQTPADNDDSQRSYLSKMIGYLKMNITKNIHEQHPGIRIWQRSYHDTIVRGEEKYLKIWKYINDNPMIWQYDCFYTEEDNETTGDS